MRTTRFSGADWASEIIHTIYIIGLGGIGSWTALNIGRIGHGMLLVDGDSVDETNVNGGQLYRTKDVGKSKVDAIQEICRELGCIAEISPYEENYNWESFGMTDVCICGLDNMAARNDVFSAWENHLNEREDEGRDLSECLFIDGRLLMENMEIFAIRGDDEEAIAEYKEKHLFDDSEVADLDCTTKQSTFGAMTIAGLITATLCNFMTNKKLGMEFREIPFHQRMYLPIMDYKKSESLITA